MELIVAEKPSVARDLASVLGSFRSVDGALVSDNQTITWCIGHVAKLAPPAAYHEEWSNWSFDYLPMIPPQFDLQPAPRTLDHWKVLSRLLTDAKFDRIINACDAGREGELIFRRAYTLAGATAPIFRLWLSSLTKEAITAAFADLRPAEEFDDLYDAARCRAQADWLIGLNATRAMTLAARAAGHQGGVKSIGRVQTPTLSLLVTRAREIENFSPTPFFQGFATLTQNQSSLEVKLQTEHSKDRLFDEAKAKSILADVDGADASINTVDITEKSVAPPSLFNLTSLQREMNKRHNLTAQQTLDAAQALYESGYVTYPRTDSSFLPEDQRSTIRAVLAAFAQDTWASVELSTPPIPTEILQVVDDLLTSPDDPTPHPAIFNDDAVSDHHAIIPTQKALASNVSEPQTHIYHAVLRRFVAQFCGPAKFQITTLDVTIENHPFAAKGRVLENPGWRTVDPPQTESKTPFLPSVTEGSAAVVDTRLHRGQTQPPNPYTESSLLRAMETAGGELDEKSLRKALSGAGLGTPATRAAIIEKLIARKYSKRDGKYLLPTNTGFALYDSLPSKGLKSPRLTARWEQALQRIAQGDPEIDRETFMTKVRGLTKTVVESIRKAKLTFSTPDPLGNCPLCETHVTPRNTVFTCENGRDCAFVIPKQFVGRQLSEKHVRTLLSGETLGPLNGFISKKGKNFTASLKLNEKGRIDFLFDN